MYRTGHQGVNLVLFAPVLAALALAGHVALGVLGALVVFVTASLPDVDLRLPLVAHRGITHTVWAAAVAGLAVAVPVYALGERAVAVPELAVYEPAVLAGYAGGVVAFSVLGHLVGDLLTPMGIRPFTPLWGRSFTLNLWRADSRANRVLFGLGVVAVSATVYLLGGV